jgi:hypothetical protein
VVGCFVPLAWLLPQDVVGARKRFLH